MKGEASSVAETAQKLVGKIFGFELSPHGEVVKMEGIDELARVCPDPGMERYWREVVRMTAEPLFLPDKAFGMGESWESEMSIPLPVSEVAGQPLKCKITHTLVGIEKVEGDEAARTKLRLVMLPTTITPQPWVTTEFSGEGSGSSLFELKNGIYRDVDLEMKLTLDIMVPTSEGRSLSMSGQAQISSRGRVKSLELVPIRKK